MSNHTARFQHCGSVLRLYSRFEWWDHTCVALLPKLFCCPFLPLASISPSSNFFLVDIDVRFALLHICSQNFEDEGDHSQPLARMNKINLYYIKLHQTELFIIKMELYSFIVSIFSLINIMQNSFFIHSPASKRRTRASHLFVIAFPASCWTWGDVIISLGFQFLTIIIHFRFDQSSLLRMYKDFSGMNCHGLGNQQLY